jgi:hypothetical protein
MVDFDPDFPKADPVSRGCGDRGPGGVYVESGLSSGGQPLEEFLYQYHPTGESADGLAPGVFAVLPITGFALISYQDGSVNERAKEKIVAGLEAHGSHAIPVYETDR